jgi:hypothetical protein
MLYFYLGYLPWQKDHLIHSSKNYSLKKVKNKKKDLLSFLKDVAGPIPEEICIFFNYALSLSINDEVDYKMLYLLFARLLNTLKYTKETLASETRLPNKNNLLYTI